MQQAEVFWKWSYRLILKEVRSLLGDCREQFDDEYEREAN